MRTLLFLTVISTSACVGVTQRTIFPATYKPIQTESRPLKWRLGSVSVAPSERWSASLGPVSYQQMLDTIRAHVQTSLSADPALGVVATGDGIAYTLDVAIRLEESLRPNQWAIASLSTTGGLAATGAVVGVLVGGPIGSLVGAAIGLGVAMPSTAAMPTLTADGFVVGQVTLRKPDGVEFGRLEERAEWVVPTSHTSRLIDDIGLASGKALTVLEQKLAASVAHVLDGRSVASPSP